MFGRLYDQALGGEPCWIRHADGTLAQLPVWEWISGPRCAADIDDALIELCQGPTIDLGCGPGRLVHRLIHSGIPALGVDVSPAAIQMARKMGAPVLRRDVFGPLPGVGRWQTVLLADGNVGIGGDPWRTLRRAAELLCRGGSCIAEFNAGTTGVDVRWVRLESKSSVGPWFRWASVGADCAAEVSAEVGLTMRSVASFGERMLATLSLP